MLEEGLALVARSFDGGLVAVVVGKVGVASGIAMGSIEGGSAGMGYGTTTDLIEIVLGIAIDLPTKDSSLCPKDFPLDSSPSSKKERSSPR